MAAGILLFEMHIAGPRFVSDHSINYDSISSNSVTKQVEYYSVQSQSTPMIN